jgi:hypothetical protein
MVDSGPTRIFGALRERVLGVIALGTPPTASDAGEQVVTWFPRPSQWRPLVRMGGHREHSAICNDVRTIASVVL